MTKRTLATFRIDESQWQAFKEKTTAQGSTATAELSKFISAYISGDTQSDIQSDIQRIDEKIYSRISELSERLDQHDDRLKKLSA